MQKINVLLVVFVAVIIGGCEAIGVPVTDDPAKKLGMAIELIDHENRPLPAERQIEEAISIYKSNDDQIGLARAYSVYGYFFRSDSVSNWGKYFAEHPFVDKDATFATRYARSIYYYQLAADIYTSKGMLDLAANTHFNMGMAYAQQQDTSHACSMLDQAMADHAAYEQTHPGVTYNLPPGVASYRDYVAQEKTKVGC
jgi:hypothetical protein